MHVFAIIRMCVSPHHLEMGGRTRRPKQRHTHAFINYKRNFGYNRPRELFVNYSFCPWIYVERLCDVAETIDVNDVMFAFFRGYKVNGKKILEKSSRLGFDSNVKFLTVCAGNNFKKKNLPENTLNKNIFYPPLDLWSYLTQRYIRY